MSHRFEPDNSTPSLATPSPALRTGTERLHPRGDDLPRSPGVLSCARRPTPNPPGTHPPPRSSLWARRNHKVTARASTSPDPTLNIPYHKPIVLDRAAFAGSVSGIDEARLLEVSVAVRLVFTRTPLCPMSRVTPFSHTPTPAGEISRPRTQAVLDARSAWSGDRGVREWASSPKARERTCFISSFRPCASLSACGARSARERACRRRNPRAFGRDTARATQPARIIAPHRAAPCKLIGFLRAVHKRRHRTFPRSLSKIHHCIP